MVPRHFLWVRMSSLSKGEGSELQIWSAGACSRFRIGDDLQGTKRRQAAALQKVTGFIVERPLRAVQPPIPDYPQKTSRNLGLFQRAGAGKWRRALLQDRLAMTRQPKGADGEREIRRGTSSFLHSAFCILHFPNAFLTTSKGHSNGSDPT